jgi:hypothetical protein
MYRYVEAELTRIHRLRREAEATRLTGPNLLLVVALFAVISLVCCALGYEIGATPPAPIVILLRK